MIYLKNTRELHISIEHQVSLIQLFLSVSSVWSTWHNDSECSVSCGVGVRTRIRYCHIVNHLNEYQHNHNCPGTKIRTELCIRHPCSGNRFSSLVNYLSMIMIRLVINNLHFFTRVQLTLSLALLDQHALKCELVLFVALIIHFFLQILNDHFKNSFVIIFFVTSFHSAWQEVN